MLVLAACRLRHWSARSNAPRPRMHSPPLQLRNVKRLGKQFSFGRQEDSHELFIRLTEAIEAVQVGL